MKFKWKFLFKKINFWILSAKCQPFYTDHYVDAISCILAFYQICLSKLKIPVVISKASHPHCLSGGFSVSRHEDPGDPGTQHDYTLFYLEIIDKNFEEIIYIYIHNFIYFLTFYMIILFWSLYMFVVSIKCVYLIYVKFIYLHWLYIYSLYQYFTMILPGKKALTTPMMITLVLIIPLMEDRGLF